MRAKSKKIMFVVLIATVLTFSVLSSALAVTPAVQAFLDAKEQWSKILNLTDQDFQDAVNLHERLVDNAWGSLTNDQKDNLQTTYKVNDTVLKSWLDNGFLPYINNNDSHGITGFAGFKDALDGPNHVVNLTYLIDLARYINSHGFNETKLAVGNKGIDFVDAVKVVVKMTNYKFDPGPSLTTGLIDGYEVVRNDIVARSNGSITIADLDNCGIQTSTLQAAINGLNDTEKAQLNTILDKLDLVKHKDGGGGGGGGDQPDTKVDPPTGGTVELGDEISIQIPPGALQGINPLSVLIEKVTESTPALPAGFRLQGSVFELSVNGESHYNFNCPVTLTFKFDPNALAEGEIPVVEFYDEALGRWVSLVGTISGDTISVSIDHFTKFAVMAKQKEEVVLTDIAGHWAENDIKQLVALGAITGYTDGSFKPDNSITRAEFATVLVKAFNLASQSGKVFTDTDKHWAKDFIATAASYGIIKGYDAVTFGPDDFINREQMAVMIVRAAKLDTVSEGTFYSDAASISAWAKDAVATTVKAGIFNGYSDNTFKPLDDATRAEAVTVIVKALK